MKFVRWQRNLLSELRVTELQTVVLNQDNTTAILLVTSEDPCAKHTKHILARINYVRQMCTDGILEVQHCSTESMLADVLTKPLQGAKFFEHRGNLLNMPRLKNNAKMMKVKSGYLLTNVKANNEYWMNQRIQSRTKSKR